MPQEKSTAPSVTNACAQTVTNSIKKLLVILVTYVDDPYLTEVIERDPVKDEVEVLIVGGGFGGLIAGARLRDAGIDDLRIVEKGGDFGGTWYWNRYPGAACDIESYIYLPLCEELNFVPKEKYTHAPEILQHSRNIGEKYDLYRNACFQTEVTGMAWQEDTKQWLVTTNRGDEMRARFVVMSNGPLNRPKLPGIPGIGDYKGHTFHTSRWDYDYTGGGPDGDLNKLKDKTVGIIGTGATAVQCVPHLGKGRSSSTFSNAHLPRSTCVTIGRLDPEWAASLKPGWQKERMENFNTLTSGGIVEKDLIQDGWTEIIRNPISMANYRGQNLDRREIAQLMELEDFQKMEQVRARAEEIVDDPGTAESLKPFYRQFCKRPCFHDEYLPTFNRDHVKLVDTDGKGVERITEKGIVANGEEFEVDRIIFATGFEVGTEYTRRSGYDPVGKGGLKLSENGRRTQNVTRYAHLRFSQPIQHRYGAGGFTTNFLTPWMSNPNTSLTLSLIA